jgi:predicted dithiol-disulfide oxidoreductase (DUF899 family)
MQPHNVVSREEWIAARKAHLAHEKEYTKARERLPRSAARCHGSGSTRIIFSTGQMEK